MYKETIPPASFDFVIVAKMRREYWNQGIKCVAEPSNVYFHVSYDNPLFQPFECIQRKLLTFNIQMVKIHRHALPFLTTQHKALLRDLNLYNLIPEQ
jgi:hypothetical protein